MYSAYVYLSQSTANLMVCISPASQPLSSYLASSKANANGVTTIPDPDEHALPGDCTMFLRRAASAIWPAAAL